MVAAATKGVPNIRPMNPHFSSGPCAKHPGWSLENLQNACLGRSHRSKPGKAKLAEAITRTATLLGMPGDYRLAIVPASDTGAVEMALWSLLGARGIDILAWESFGSGWVNDVMKQLKLKDVRVFESDYGVLPDLAQVDKDRDVIFTWNGTTSGVRVQDGKWIAADRGGLTICDATSAAFAQELPWDKLDVVTFSWQKVLGSEAAHGMLALSPRAVERLESYTPPWPMPKLFRMTSGGKLMQDLFQGATINTPSMLAVEDYLSALSWAEKIGGLPALIARADANLKIISDWVGRTHWVDFLAADPAIRSNTSVCLRIVDPSFTALDGAGQTKAAKQIASLLEAKNIAYDIDSYRDAPPGLRIWAGATVEGADLTALLPWLEWAWGQIKN